jgi:hypothetical protein
MKDRLKVFPEEPRGSAWPSSARTVRRTVKSVNERDPHHYLLSLRRLEEHYSGTACDECEEGAGNDRSVCSESPGLHARNNDMDNGILPRKGTLILETISKFRLWVVTHPHDAGIPSNQSSSYSGEYVPAPCTHRPSNQPSRV